MGNQRGLVETLLDEGGEIKWAMNGAGTGGHFELLNYLMSRGGNLNDALDGIQNGHHAELIDAMVELDLISEESKLI